MTTEFKKLLNLEKSRKITISIKRDHANNFWYGNTTIGKILNWLTYVFVLVVIFIFIKLGMAIGIVSVIFLSVYVKVLNHISGLYIRLILFNNEKLFNAAYESGSCTIYDNSGDQAICFPTDWHVVLEK